MASKTTDLVLMLDQSSQQGIDPLQTSQTGEDHSWGSLKGVLDCRWELGRLFGALNNPSEMDLGLGSAWIAGLHCKDEIQRLVLFKSEITRFRALKTVPERSVRSVLLLNVGVPTRRHAILGTVRRGLLLSIGRASRQLEKRELRLLQPGELGLKQALESYPKAFHQCKPAQR